ncbi:MAG: class I adenylate-forming enzyme family protein [Polyangiaceae bacterium]
MFVPEALREVEKQLLGEGGMFETVPATVLGESMRVFKNRARSLRDFVAASTRLGDVEHLVFSDGQTERRITFAEHACLVARMANVLQTRYGVGPGDRVAILAANCPEWIITFWATVSLGAVAVGLNAWWTASEIRFGVADASPKLLVLDRKRRARLDGEIDVPTLVIEDDFAATLEAASPDVPLPAVPIDEDDPAIILYTSGTTGRPKGAVHSHRNVIALVGLGFFNGARMRAILPPSPHSPCIFVTSPLFHVSGLHNAAIACLAGGVKTVWLAGRFDAKVAFSLIEKERATSWAYTATLLHRAVHHPDAKQYDLSSLWQLGGGGSSIPVALQTRAREVFTSAAQTLGVGYGLTECTSLATINSGPELLRFPESVGRPMPTVEIEVRDPSGAVLPDGNEGEIHVRSPLVMREYWKNPAATTAVLLPGRWLKTGDVGKMVEGRLYLSSRRDDLILRGGENVYPAEIEQRLEAHPDVAEAAVVGIEHQELGQEVKAFVVPKMGRTLNEVALAAWIAEALAYFKVPSLWEVRAEPLPRNATGKVVKHVLRDRGASTFIDE